MDQKIFIVLNAILVTLVVLFFLRGKRKAEPSRLNLGKVDLGNLNVYPNEKKPFQDGVSDSPNERVINVIFQYNGHSWDAYQVLGLPAGSAKGDAEKAFDQKMRSASHDEREFFQAAIKAVRSS